MSVQGSWVSSQSHVKICQMYDGQHVRSQTSLWQSCADVIACVGCMSNPWDLRHIPVSSSFCFWLDPLRIWWGTIRNFLEHTPFCGSIMQAAYNEFFEAFKNYQETGNASRAKIMLKYVARFSGVSNCFLKGSSLPSLLQGGNKSKQRLTIWNFAWHSMALHGISVHGLLTIYSLHLSLVHSIAWQHT